MVRKLLVIATATAIAGFIGAANAGDTPDILASANLPDILASANLKVNQTLTSEDMSKVVGTAAAAAAAGGAAATTGNYATASQYTSANVSLYYYGGANAYG